MRILPALSTALIGVFKMRKFDLGDTYVIAVVVTAIATHATGYWLSVNPIIPTLVTLAVANVGGFVLNVIGAVMELRT